MSQPLCRLEDLEDPGSAAFTITWAGERRSILVARQGDRVFAYLNNCPHIGAPLDWQHGQFLDRDRRHILCSSHGALFRLDDGACIGGPCAGKPLESIPLTLNDGVVLVAKE